MRTGIIMEMDESFLTLLTPEGEFLRARRKEKVYSIGEEITFEPALQSHNKKGFVFGKLAGMKRTWIAAAAAIIIMASGLIPLQGSNQVYAYMSIDVNPSIELGVNDKMQVLKLNAYNSAGKKIVSGLKDWEKENVSTVAENILSEIGRQGYFTETNTVIISAVKTDKEEKQAEKKLNETIKEISATAKKENHEVTVINGSAKDLKEARKRGVTTGIYKAGVETTKTVETKPVIQDVPQVVPVPSAVPSKEGKKNTPPGQAKKELNADPANKESKGNEGKKPKSESGKDKPGQKEKTDNKENGKNNKEKNKDKKNNGHGNGQGNNLGDDKENNPGKKGKDAKGGDQEKKRGGPKEKNNEKGKSEQKPSPQSKGPKPVENKGNPNNNEKKSENKGKSNNGNKDGNKSDSNQKEKGKSGK
ncbi:anti-sigma factor domain-containing protein [Bacillus sp. FJAT-27445]|uniref:anti-sigma factor domain-containing protein n=1 Tax=Bacillus sp. FJAT-27445 TaxID=1679166 RepID=UPI00074382AC|nr:anti-sigma factor domain-containing protein [Bacillus sp. FJAT-27445]